MTIILVQRHPKPERKIPNRGDDMANQADASRVSYLTPPPLATTSTPNPLFCSGNFSQVLLSPLTGPAYADNNIRGEWRKYFATRTILWSLGEQPAFVVLGLVGAMEESVLLLPTMGRRQELGTHLAQSGEERPPNSSVELLRSYLCTKR